MKGSLKRVQAVMNGQKPDRILPFDLIANDVVQVPSFMIACRWKISWPCGRRPWSMRCSLH